MELPEWEMDDNGLITTSSLANAKAMIYTFIEAALAHNDKILFDKQNGLIEVVDVESPTSEEALQMLVDTIKNADLKASVEVPMDLIPEADDEEDDEPEIFVTKADLNVILAGMYTPQGVRRWWYRPRKQLDGQTPTQVWEDDPDKVIRLIHGFKDVT